MSHDIFIIFIVCLFIVPIYFKTRSFNSINGVILFLSALSTLFLRILFHEKYPLRATIQTDSFLQSFVLALVPLLLISIYALITERITIKNRCSYFIKLLPLYLFFGALQQVFFLSVFTDSVYYITQNNIATFVISVIYFFIFHLNWSNERKYFRIFIIGFSIINTFTYIWFHNIIPQMVLHGLVASIFYTAFSQKNVLKSRLSKN